METLEAIQQRIQSAVDLYGIVRTMKTLAAANIRQFDRASEAVNAYFQTINIGLQIVLQERSSQPSGRINNRGSTAGAIIFGTDQGMCGQFNENIIRFALNDLRENSPTIDPASIMVTGLRAAARLQENGVSFNKLFSVPSSVNGINFAVQALLLEIQRWRENENLEKVYLYYNRPTSGSSYQPAKVQLFPIDMDLFRNPVRHACSSKSMPVFTIERSRLQSLLLRQYIFVLVYRAFAESLSSENASRLLTMQAAEKNIEERLVELRSAFHNRRQGAITSELLDIVSGFEALAT